MMRLEAYRRTDIEGRSYRKPQEAQMTSTVVECLQGIQTAKEATASDKNGSGNPMIRYEHSTRADDANTRYTMCSNALYVTDGRGTETESRELAAGVDGNSGAGTGMDGPAARWKGRARCHTL
jgi:hypothetical protein